MDVFKYTPYIRPFMVYLICSDDISKDVTNRLAEENVQTWLTLVFTWCNCSLEVLTLKLTLKLTDQSIFKFNYTNSNK